MTTYTTSELCERHDVHPRTLRKWAAAGRLERVERGVYRYPDEERVSEPEAQAEDTGSVLVEAPEYTLVADRGVYVFHHLPGERRAAAIPRATVEELVARYSNHGGGATINTIARQYGLSRAQVTYILRALGKTHDSAPYTDEQIAEGDERELAEDLVRSKENRILVRAQRMDWQRTQEDAERWRLFERSVLPRLEGLRVYVPPADLIPYDRAQFGHTLVATPSDIHLGKADVATHTRQAKDAWRAHLSESVLRHGYPDTLLMGVGSDWMHIDTPGRTTTRGTHMVCTEEYGALLERACALSVELVSMASQVCSDVRVVLMAGNHDRASAHALFAVLKVAAQQIEGVSIASAERYAGRAYVATDHGLFGFAHGDQCKVKDLPRLMAMEQPQAWGEHRERAWFVGHLHHERAVDDHGVRIFQLPALCTADQWHREQGYIGAHPGITGHVFGVDSYLGSVYTPMGQ